MADPTRHQIENGAAGWQNLTIEVGDRGDRGRVDLSGPRQLGTCKRVGAHFKVRWCSDWKKRHIPRLQPVWLQIGMARRSIHSQLRETQRFMLLRLSAREA